MATVADQQGYALLGQQQAPLRAESGSYGGWGSAAYILVFVVVFIIIIAFLGMAFWDSDSKWGSDSSSDDHRERYRKGGSWNFEWLAGLIIFIIVLLFLCWLMGSFSHRSY